MVAPFVGAWIEITENFNNSTAVKVAPFVGAWIEIHKKNRNLICMERRSLRGSVD